MRDRIAAFAFGIGVVSLLGIYAVSFSAQELSVVGSYTVSGTNPDNSLYTQRAEITEHNGILRMTQATDQGIVAMAICLREGAVVSCIFQTSDSTIGLASYRLEGDRWVGKWHVPGTDSVMTETLTKADPRLRGAENGPKSVI